MHLKIPPPIVAFVCGLAIWQSGRLLPIMMQFDALRRDMAIVLAITAIGIDLFALSAFIRSRTTLDPRCPHKTTWVVTTGVYGYTRNPMYLGLALLLTALSLYLGAVAGPVVVALFVWYTTIFQIMPEERELEVQFGKNYRDYKTRVRRWL